MAEQRSYPSFRLYQDAKGEWRWTYNSKNGQAIAMACEGYSSRAAAERSIEIMQETAGHLTHHDMGE